MKYLDAPNTTDHSWQYMQFITEKLALATIQNAEIIKNWNF